MKLSRVQLQSYEIVFWDFDGVIKESLEVKGSAFQEIFCDYGKKIGTRIVTHHYNNGGISRYKKIPLYLQWCGLDPNNKNIEIFSSKFSEKVIKKVIESKWVPGVKEFLIDNFRKFKFILITATPSYEIEIILNKIGLNNIFLDVFGSEISKSEAINISLKKYYVSPCKALMIGDSESDYIAAINNKISFFLRQTKYNKFIKHKYDLKEFENFLY